MDRNSLFEIDGLKFKTKPWNHQLLALKFLMQRKQAALYTDMGTGKSKVMIDLIVNRGYKFVLIVCTNKGCEVWQKQFRLHSHIDPQNVLNLAGVSTLKKVQVLQQNLSQVSEDPSGGILVLLVNYEGVWRDKFI